MVDASIIGRLELLAGSVELHVEESASTPETLMCALVMRLFERDCLASVHSEREQARCASMAQRWSFALEETAEAIRRRSHVALTKAS